VMLETGQPLHFYNLAKLANKDIVVKDNIEMSLVALDGIAYDVCKDDIVITTNDQPTGLAGIMGGDDSKIDEETQSIFIEAAHFNDVAIRNTARRLGLATEAATRFIKGIEPLAAKKAIDRCVELLSELADATDFESNVEAGNNEYQEVVVKESLQHCNQLLGTNFSKQQVVDVLNALDFKVEEEQDNFICHIPSYRTDIKIAQDIDEEVIRLLGYDDLKETLPTMSATVGALNPQQKLRRMIKNTLVGMGLNEIVTYTLTKEEHMQDSIMPFGEAVAVMSPLSEDRRYMRSSLMASVLTCLSYNQNRQSLNNNLFEISAVTTQDKVQERLAICLNGHLGYDRLHNVAIKSDFYTLKGMIYAILERYGFNASRIMIKENTLDTTHFHPYRSACVYIGRDLLGIFGQVHPSYAAKMDVDNCVYAELILDVILANKVSKVRFVPLDKYPSVSRDIALVVKEDVQVQKIIETIKRNSNQLVRNVEVFDIYQGEHVEKGYKSVALNIIYQAGDHTLKDDEINACHNNILENLQNKLDAKLRG
ncbi:MAG: phenylalanine--tRNA ligase subunit beta, partial [Erysipelotrichaceae bacterium]|nr:phenylalanine--tRNA ligase subunit beta [Erysipelotrichaceae bacterium]